MVECRWVHEIRDGIYVIRYFEEDASTIEPAIKNGERVVDTSVQKRFKFINEVIPKAQGNVLDSIPAWPLNGSIEPVEPILMGIINKEISLYNKISRRNHLMYGAATYTPVVIGNIPDDAFEEIVASGLGTWLRLPDPDGKIDVLKPPSEPLKDMETAIANGYIEIAKLGVRMLAPETGDQSGVALELRNAAQVAVLASLNTKISAVMRQIISFMLNWRYDLKLTVDDIKFTLSDDFNPVPQGADWLRLATEWYQSGLIPRKIWLLILKQNDMVPSDYNDEEGSIS